MVIEIVMVADNIDVMSARAQKNIKTVEIQKQICRTLKVFSHTFLFIPRGPRGKKKELALSCCRQVNISFFLRLFCKIELEKILCVPEQ